MTSTAAISPIGTAHSFELVPPEMLDSGASMATFAKDSDLVNEIALLHEVLFLLVCKDNHPLANEISLIHPYHFFGHCRKKMQ